MDRLKLVLPELEHKEIAEDFKKEFFEFGEMIINGSALLDKMEYEDWLANIKNNSKQETVRGDWVVADTFFAIRESDDRIIGIIDIRHNLNNEFLLKYGGHIGYAVRPGERQRGYATKMLKQALDYVKKLNMSRVMLGCHTDNTASIRTIEKCGGRLAEVKPYLDGKMMNVYWISL